MTDTPPPTDEVSLTALHESLSETLQKVAHTGRPVTVLRFGKPLVVIAPAQDPSTSVVPSLTRPQP